MSPGMNTPVTVFRALAKGIFEMANLGLLTYVIYIYIHPMEKVVCLGSLEFFQL